MIRLSEAVARLHCSEDVLESHVDLALKVMRNSFKRVEEVCRHCGIASFVKLSKKAHTPH